MSARRRAARGLGLGPLVLFSAALACSSPSGGCSFDGEFWRDGFWDVPPTPTPELIDAPDGGRLYLLLDGPAGPAIHVVQVGTNETASLLPIATVTSATSLAFDPVSGGFRVADASRFGIALLDETAEEVGFLDTVSRPVDVEYAPLLERTFVATTKGLLIFDAEDAMIDGLWPTDSLSTAVSVQEREVLDEEDDGYPPGVVETYAALSTITEAGGTVYTAWWRTRYGDDLYGQFADSYWEMGLADSSCVPQPDDVLAGFELPLFIGDSACDRIFVDGSSANLGAAASGSKPMANRLAWSEEREVMLAAEADSLFVLDPVTRTAETVAGFARATVVTGSIGGRNIWVGSAALDSASQPVLHRWAVGPPVDMPAGPAGTTVVDVDYYDRPPRFLNLNGWGGTIGAVTKRGRLGYYRVEAVDDDGDIVVIAVPDAVNGLRFDDDTHAFTWRIPCDEEATHLRARVTATAARYRAPIDFVLFIDDDEPGDPCAEE